MTTERYRHKKRGMVYEIMTTFASLQCSSAPAFEQRFKDDNWTVYRNILTGTVYVRPTAEFMDGRFELVPTPGPAGERGHVGWMGGEWDR